MDQGLGPERLRRAAEGTVGPGGQRQCGQGTIKAERDHCEMLGVKVLEKHEMLSGVFFSPFQVKKAFQGRVTLPGYNENRYNASLALSGLRSSDSGLYRCEVVVGINDEQDTVPLEVTGK